MLFLLPVSSSDKHLVQGLALIFAKFSGLKEHRALVVSAPTTQKEATEYASLVDPLFKRTDIYITPRQPPSGWPQGCNQYFAMAAKHQELSGNSEPWYWFEADNVPLVDDWIKQINDQVELCKMPFLGAKIETWKHEANGLFQDGHHMMGSGIYPPNLSKYSMLYQCATDEPWDVWCQWEIVPNMHPTKLIQHNWSTHQYRRAGKGGAIIMCDQLKTPTHPTSRSILKDAVVLHGCKDTSLQEIILAK